MTKVLITGGSGLLGRALIAEFKKYEWEVLGLAFSRAEGGLVKVDLNDADAVFKTIENFKPQVIIHCAAERSPEKVENDYEGSKKLNVECSRRLAEFAGIMNAAFLYISTDYVFDGKNPPYKEDAKPCPVNKYGLSKYEGEKAVQAVNKSSCILRIPILYGEDEYIGESAISHLLNHLLSTEISKVSNYEIRYPSCTLDIAVVCRELMEKKLQDPELSSVFHWCGEEALTKYDMMKIMSRVFSLSDSLIIRDDNPSYGIQRPKNTQLSCDRLKSLNIGQHTTFADGVLKCLSKLLPHMLF